MEYILFAHGRIEIGKYLKSALINYFILFATAIVTAFVFFPATWVKLSVLVKATIGNAVFSSTWPLFVGVIGLLAIDIFIFKVKFSNIVFDFFVKYRDLIIKIFGISFLLLAVFVFLHVYAGLKIYNLQAIIASPKGIGSGSIPYKYLGALSADLYSLIFSISPLILIFLLFSVFGILRKKELKRDSITVIYIIIFIFIFYLGSAVNAVVNTVRYQIMVYPLAFVLAAIGITEIMKIEKIKKYIPTSAVYVLSMIILLASMLFVKPNYLAYASEILPHNFIVNLKGMGEGSFEAASYLNSLPNAHDMTIWSDKGAVCERFVGRCFIDFKQATFTQNKMDYFVVSTDRKSRTLKLSGSAKKMANFQKAYESKDNAFEVLIDNNSNDFVKVIKSENILITPNQ
jgi:hypothetical protein